jgi:hypothetical protein
MWKCFSYLMFLHFAIEFPLMCIAHPLMHFLGIKNTLPLPAWYVYYLLGIFYGLHRADRCKGVSLLGNVWPALSLKTSISIGFTDSCTGMLFISTSTRYIITTLHLLESPQRYIELNSFQHFPEYLDSIRCFCGVESDQML